MIMPGAMGEILSSTNKTNIQNYCNLIRKKKTLKVIHKLALKGFYVHLSV